MHRKYTKNNKKCLNLPCILRPNGLFTVAGGGDQPIIGNGARFHAQRIAGGGARLGWTDAPAEGGGQLDKVGGEFLVCKERKRKKKEVSKLKNFLKNLYVNNIDRY